jgi:hypothetical protein
MVIYISIYTLSSVYLCVYTLQNIICLNIIDDNNDMIITRVFNIIDIHQKTAIANDVYQSKFGSQHTSNIYMLIV